MQISTYKYCFVNNREPAASVTSQSRKRIGLFTNPSLHIKWATLRDKNDFSKNSHSTETNFNYSTNFESAKSVRSSNVVELEFELRHIPTLGKYRPVAYILRKVPSRQC